MDMSLQKRFGSGSRALLAVLGCVVLASLVFADASSAAVPPTGVNCVASDGKISGRGSTFQSVLLSDYAQLYRDDFCGNTPKEPEDPAGNTMVTYNYPAAESASATGSGAGIKAASCRSDAFSGTDTPYSEAQLTELNEAPGKLGGTACKLAFDPPFQPQAPSNEYPNAADITAPVMSFPVAGSSVTVPVNLTGTCTKGTPTALKFDAKEVSRLFGGDIATWSDSELVATNSILATDECTGAVTRVVRQDSSGTTNIFKQYLIRAENERSSSVTCAVGKKWSEYFTTNTEWPGKQNVGKEGTCSTITTGPKSGNLELLTKLKETDGGVGYVDLGQEAGATGVIVATVESSLKTEQFEAPNTGKAANCTFAGVVTPPGNGSAAEAVGLFNTEGHNWANNAEPNENNVTDRGSKYPICGLTWDLVFSGLDNGAVANAIAPLTADQRRTEYSFFTFILSSAAQNFLGTINYAPLPAAWLQELREGFQENF